MFLRAAPSRPAPAAPSPERRPPCACRCQFLLPPGWWRWWRGLPLDRAYVAASTVAPNNMAGLSARRHRMRQHACTQAGAFGRDVPSLSVYTTLGPGRRSRGVREAAAYVSIIEPRRAAANAAANAVAAAARVRAARRRWHRCARGHLRPRYCARHVSEHENASLPRTAHCPRQFGNVNLEQPFVAFVLSIQLGRVP